MRRPGRTAAQRHFERQSRALLTLRRSYDLLAEGFGAYTPHMLLFCLAMWLGGGMLYIWIISLIFYRYTFFVMSPSDLAPPYWINMGAAAISTLAGTALKVPSEVAARTRNLYRPGARLA